MNKKDSRSRKDRAFETRSRLYATADAMFTQYGFDNVSVDRIVVEAGLSKGTFYVHFESKDDLLVSLISDYVEKVDMDYQAFIDTFSPDMPAADILLHLTEKIMDVIIDTIGLERMKTLYRAQLTNISRSGTAASYQRMLYKTIMDVLDRGMQRREFVTTLTLEELANHLILAMRGLTYEWCIRYPDFDLKTQSRTHFEIILKGIQKECQS
ncbi:MAG: TetR/AcrR family transcriptional regulator [Christensenellales bacterium]|jgi:TetR/AcrR family fatty acid metabolism transcriptional regulator